MAVQTPITRYPLPSITQDTLPLNIVDKVIGILATQHSLSSLTANDGESEDDKHWREMKRIMMRFSGRLISLTKDADGET